MKLKIDKSTDKVEMTGSMKSSTLLMFILTSLFSVWVLFRYGFNNNIESWLAVAVLIISVLHIIADVIGIVKDKKSTKSEEEGK